MNHPNRAGAFELVFIGADALAKAFPSYRRRHKTREQAERLAGEILDKLPDRQAHPAVIYGPECGPAGLMIA